MFRVRTVKCKQAATGISAFQNLIRIGPSEIEYREELDRLLSQAVKRQLVADVELGTYRGGGLRHGACAARESYMRTFNGFDLHQLKELGMDEREKAEKMSNVFEPSITSWFSG